MISSTQKSESFRIFDKIAGKYDFINSVLSLGLHSRWRKKILPLVPTCESLVQVLDLATGTGDVALTLAKDRRIGTVNGLDLSEGMIHIGRSKVKKAGFDQKIELTVGSALEIPFPNRAFDMITMAFGIRNVSDVPRCLGECLRVLKPSGRVVLLEFALPESTFMRHLHLFYLRHILARVGRTLSGHQSAYSYLNQTIEDFPYGKEFCGIMKNCGFTRVGYQSLSFGVVHLYWGEKE